MNAEILPLLNLALHGVLLGALSWTLVRFFVRDARHRSIAASVAILVTVLGPLGITLLPSWPETTEIPVLKAIHQTLEADWNVMVQPPRESLPEPDSTTPPPPRQTWSPGLTVNALGWVWAAGALGWFLLHLLRTIRVWGWSGGLRRATASELETLPDSLRNQELRVFDHAGSPCVVGWLRPVIAVPASAFGRLSPRQWHWAIRHEREHLRGADTRVLWLHECARAVVWWNPFVHGLAEIHSLAREEVCDAEALEDYDETNGYSEFLLGWASRPVPTGAAASSGVMAMARSRPVRRLKARLLALAEGRRVGRRVRGWFIASLTMLALLITGAVSLVGFSTAAAQTPAPVAEKETGDAELFTRSYQVSPDFLPGLAGGVEAKSALEKKGIEFPAGASAILMESSSKLIARNTRTAHAKIESLVAASLRQFPQVHFQGRFIQTDHFLGKHGEVISSQAAEQMIREMSQKKGVDLLSAPSVTSRQGQQAVVEICRENPANEQQKVGLRQELNAVAASNGKVELQTKTEFFKAPGVPMLPPRDLASVDWDRVKTYEVAGKAPLASGETLVLHLPMDSLSVTVLISVKAVRPDGKNAASFNESIDTAPARKTGDGAMLPADAFDREVEQSRDAEKRSSVPRITLKMVTASFSDGRQIERALMPDAAAEENSGNTPPVSSDTGWILRAVFVEEQLQKMLGHLKKDPKASLTPAIQKMAAGGAETVFTSANGYKLGAFKVTPVIGADGYTVDLRVELHGDGTGVPKFPPTSVTVWNGQTVMFCSSPSGTGKDATAIFLTVGWPEK